MIKRFLRYITAVVAVALAISTAMGGISSLAPSVLTASDKKYDAQPSAAAPLLTAVSKASDEADAAQNNEKENLKEFLDYFTVIPEYISLGINDIRLYLDTPNDKNQLPKKEIFMDYTQNDGERKHAGMGVYYDEESGMIVGPSSAGIYESSFEYDARQDMFCNADVCWQSAYGFTVFYELFAPLLGYGYITDRIFFEYGGKEWMVQLWKGNYGFYIFVGGEIGLYYRDADALPLTKFTCANQDEYMLPMTLNVYDKNRSYVVRNEEKAWWLTGFAFADSVLPSSLTLEASIDFKDEGMKNAFLKALEKENNISASAENGKVSVAW